MIVIILSKGRQDSVSVKMRQNIVNSPQISHNSEENTPYIKNLTPPVLMNAREKMTEKYKKSPAKIWVLFFRDLLLCITTRTFRLSFEELDHVFCIFSPTLWILPTMASQWRCRIVTKQSIIKEEVHPPEKEIIISLLN